MSPLIDVTNIVVHDINELNKETCPSDPRSLISSEVKGDDAFSSKNSCENTSDRVNSAKTTKCNSVKHKHFKKKKQTKTSEHVETNSPTVSPNEKMLNNRVPPIGWDEHLFASLATLSISEQSRRTLISTEKHKPEAKQKCSRRTCVTGFSNDVRPPSGSFTSTYQCIACGLELSSIENLTNHLIKHVYEGLHAASWLSNAMSTLLYQDPSPLAERSSPTENKAQISDTSKPTQSAVTDNNRNSSENASSKVCDPQT